MGLNSSISCGRLIPRVRHVMFPDLHLEFVEGCLARCAARPSVEMRNPRNLRSSGRATALFASLIIIETFEPGCQPRLWPIPSIGLDSSLPSHLCRHRHPPITASVRRRDLIGTGYLALTATVNAAFGCQNPDYRIPDTVPTASRAAKPASRWSLNPCPCLEPTNQIKHGRQSQ